MNSSAKKKLNIGVLGPRTCSEKHYQVGVEVGRKIANNGGTLICGGLDGMMKAACKGAKRAGGLTIGILPGRDNSDANKYIDIAIPTNLGSYRNMIIVQACDYLIAISGGYGTLSEIGFALRIGKPVIGIGTWELVRKGHTDSGIHVVETPDEAFDYIKGLA